ncbi:Hypothetical predicted protein, partial [Podarcis lilfordi]
RHWCFLNEEHKRSSAGPSPPASCSQSSQPDAYQLVFRDSFPGHVATMAKPLLAQQNTWYLFIYLHWCAFKLLVQILQTPSRGQESTSGHLLKILSCITCIRPVAYQQDSMRLLISCAGFTKKPTGCSYD